MQAAHGGGGGSCSDGVLGYAKGPGVLAARIAVLAGREGQKTLRALAAELHALKRGIPNDQLEEACANALASQPALTDYSRKNQGAPEEVSAGKVAPVSDSSGAAAAPRLAQPVRRRAAASRRQNAAQHKERRKHDPKMKASERAKDQHPKTKAKKQARKRDSQTEATQR